VAETLKSLKEIFVIEEIPAWNPKIRSKAGGVSPPECLAVITGGGIAQKRADGVYVLPINAMKR